jgi:general secretion pathway protein H
MRGVRPRARGFTFIEVMIVISIVALAMVVALPNLEAGFDAREVRRALRQIAGAMHYCHNEAVSSGHIRRLRIDPVENKIETDDHLRWAVLTDRALIESVDGGIGGTDGAFTLMFYPNGSSSGATVVVASRRDRSQNRLRLVLDPLLGSVRVEDAG